MPNIKDKLLGIQYQYTRLFNLGLNRKKFECVPNGDKLFAMNTSKNTFLTLFFTLFSCGLLFTGFIEGFVNKAEITTGFVIVFSIHFLIGLIGLRHFLWLINGRQELTIEKGNLTLSNKGTFLTRPKTYALDQITNIWLVTDEDSLSILDKIIQNIALNRKILFRQSIGQILFSYKGETIRVFSDLNKTERTELMNEIEKRKLNK